MTTSAKTSGGSADSPDAGRIANLIHPVLDRLADVLDGIDEGQLDASTPCTEYSVRDLREHVVQWSSAFADGFADPDGQAPDHTSYTVEGTGGDQVRRNADRLSDAIADGGAERPLKIGESGMPGEMALRMILWEYQVHGWDLAAATDQSFAPADAGLQDSLEFAPGMLTPEYQGKGKSFGPRVEVPESAPALDRLVGLSGRDPQWSA